MLHPKIIVVSHVFFDVVILILVDDTLVVNYEVPNLPRLEDDPAFHTRLLVTATRSFVHVHLFVFL